MKAPKSCWWTDGEETVTNFGLIGPLQPVRRLPSCSYTLEQW